MMSHLAAERLQAISGGGNPTDDEAEHLLMCRECDGVVADFSEVDRALDGLRGAPSWSQGAEARVARKLSDGLVRPWRAPRRLAAALAVCVAAAVAAVFVYRSPRPEELSSVEILPSASARVVRSHVGPDQTVTLQGEAAFSVPRLAAGHRFRVLAGSDEVEVRGTRFRVVADDAGVTLVEVTEGRVEVRAACCGATQLARGDRWARPVASVAAPAGAAPMDAEVVVVPPVPSASHAPSPQPPAVDHARGHPGNPDQPSASDLVTQGVAAFDRGDFASAAALLDRAVAADPSSATVRDARVIAGAARVMTAPVSGVPSLSVGAASFDVAATRAAKGGDGARAMAAQVGAARRSSGAARTKRYCALAAGAVPAPWRAEVDLGCVR